MTLIVRMMLIAAMLISLVVLVFPSTAEAQGFAISGSFYRHHFQMLPGETLSTPDIYIMVFNHDEKQITVKMASQAPPGVKILLSKDEFVIPPNREQRIELAVAVSQDAVPGDYNLVISADVQRQGEGIVITGGAEQQARLTIFGEAGEVTISTISQEGESFQSDIHLYQKLNGQLSPSGFSATGDLKTRLVPGDYMVQVFSKDVEVAKQDFSVAAQEKKNIVLVAKTILVSGFSVAPNYSDGKIVFAKVVYNIQNIYKPLKNVKINLKVSFGSELLESVEMVPLPGLDAESFSSSYNYAPTAWKTGEYTFILEVYSGNKLYAQSAEQKLRVAIPSPVNWILIAVGVIVGTILVILAVLLIQKRSRKKGRKG